MTTTKTDRESLVKLRMPAERENRTASRQSAVTIDAALRASPAELTDQEFLEGMMESIVENAEVGIATEAGMRNAEAFSAAGRISWGEENGRIIGVLADGSRCDVDGNILKS